MLIPDRTNPSTNGTKQTARTRNIAPKVFRITVLHPRAGQPLNYTRPLPPSGIRAGIGEKGLVTLRYTGEIHLSVRFLTGHRLRAIDPHPAIGILGTRELSITNH